MGRIKKLIGRNKWIIAAFFMPVVLVTIALAVNGIYPFGENQIPVIDMYHQYIPFLSELQYKLQDGDSLFYTWNGAGGCNFWNLIAYYGASPLNLLLILFPKKLIVEGVTAILVVKIGLAGAFMAIYLRYANGKCNVVTMAFACLYAMCSYVMAYYWCIMWIDAVALLPLCVMGLTKIVKGERGLLYAVSLALVVLANYYIAIMVCIFILCYYPFLYFITHKKMGAKFCTVTTLRAVGYSILAIAMAAVILVPTYMSMQSTYYISSDMPDNWLFYENALDILNQLLPNSQLTYREGLPNLYCGLIVVIMMVFYVISKTIPFKEKALNIGFMAFLFLSLNVNKLDFIWHGFHFPNQLPYRYTFIVSFLLVGMAYKAFLRIDETKTVHIWAVLAAGIGYYLIAQKLMGETIEQIDMFFYTGVAWLILYCVVLALYKKGKLRRVLFVFLVAVLIGAEMLANACTSFDAVGNTLRSEYTANKDDIESLVDSISDEFARTEIDANYILNCPAYYHYMGLSQFSSSLNASTTALMEKIGLEGEPSKNRFNYNLTNPITNAILNVKYIIGKNLPVEQENFSLIKTVGNSTLYENSQALSIGYMAASQMRTWNYNDANPFVVLNDYVRAATGNEYTGVFNELKYDNISTRNVQVDPESDGLISCALESTTSESTVILNYTATENKEYYVFVEADNTAEITINRDVKEETIDVRNDCGSVINIGTLEKGETFNITLQYDEEQVGDITAHVCTLNDEVWNAAYNKLSSSMLEVTDWKSGYLKGSIVVDEAGMFVTSVPYDSGWTLKVDGKVRAINELVGGAFIATNLSEGTHEIELTFRPPGIVSGAVISLIAILMLIVITRFGKTIAAFASRLPKPSSWLESQEEESDCNRA